MIKLQVPSNYNQSRCGGSFNSKSSVLRHASMVPSVLSPHFEALNIHVPCLFFMSVFWQLSLDRGFQANLSNSRSVSFSMHSLKKMLICLRKRSGNNLPCFTSMGCCRIQSVGQVLSYLTDFLVHLLVFMQGWKSLPCIFLSNHSLTSLRASFWDCRIPSRTAASPFLPLLTKQCPGNAALGPCSLLCISIPSSWLKLQGWYMCVCLWMFHLITVFTSLLPSVIPLQPWWP